MKASQGQFEKLVDKILSRKLLVWVGTTVLYGLGKIDQSTWMYITCGYIGMQGIVDGAEKYASGKNS